MPVLDCDVLVLCGGKGSRLAEAVPDRPKPLAEVAGTPFLDILVDELLAQGLRRIVLCVGYMKEAIVARYAARSDAEFVFSEEREPLGTGGAVANALPLVRSNPFLVVNGDSFFKVDLGAFKAFHDGHDARASLVLAHADERQDSGLVRIDESERVVNFSEKAAAGGRGYVNAGMYLFQRGNAELESRSGRFSLEYDVFPALAEAGGCYGMVAEGPLVDIGTPERLAAAPSVLKRR